MRKTKKGLSLLIACALTISCLPMTIVKADDSVTTTAAAVVVGS